MPLDLAEIVANLKSFRNVVAAPPDPDGSAANAAFAAIDRQAANARALDRAVQQAANVHAEAVKQAEDKLRRSLIPSNPGWEWSHSEDLLMASGLPSKAKNLLRKVWYGIIQDRWRVPPPFPVEQRDEWLELLDDTLVAMEDTTATPRHESIIRDEGEWWLLRFGDEQKRYKARKSLSWLGKLLVRPGASLTVAELLGDTDGKLAADALLGGQEETDKAGVIGIRKRVKEIQAIRESTGGSGSEDLDNEEVRLLEQLKAFQGHKRLKTAVATSYNNITTQLRVFRTHLAAHMPQLSAHLKAAIVPHAEDYTVGYFPPDGAPRWKF